MDEPCTPKDMANGVFREVSEHTVADMQAYVRAHLLVGDIPQLLVQVAYMSALMQVAAILAVESGISKEKFDAIAAESLERATAGVPRFQ